MTLLSTAIQDYGDDELLCYLQEEIEYKGRREELMEMMTWRNPTYHDGKHLQLTSLQLALSCQKSKKVISKIIDIGGRELLMKNDKYHGQTALHRACLNFNYNVSMMEIISKMLEMGGRELLMMNDKYGYTALHWACKNENPSMEIISKMLEVGGRELLMMNDKYGHTALYLACENHNISMKIISKMLEMGGRELLMMNVRSGQTALNIICQNEYASMKIISKMLEMGGRELLLTIDKFGNTVLHRCARSSSYSSMEIISKLLEVGGRELVMMKNSGTGCNGCDGDDTALHYICQNKYASMETISKML